MKILFHLTLQATEETKFLFQVEKGKVSESDTIDTTKQIDPNVIKLEDKTAEELGELELDEPLDKQGKKKFNEKAYLTHVQLIQLDLDHQGVLADEIVQIFEPVGDGSKSWQLKVGGYSDFIIMDENGKKRFGFKKFEEGEISKKDVYDSENGIDSEEFGKCLIFRNGKWEEGNPTEEDLKDLESIKAAARLYFDMNTRTGKAPERRDERRGEKKKLKLEKKTD